MKFSTLNKLGQITIWRRFIEDFKLLLSLIKDYIKGVYRAVSVWSIIVFFLSVVYIVCPVDILPDTIPFIGQIDDTVILLLCMVFLEKDLYKYKDWKDKNPAS